MEINNIYNSIAQRSQGDIYIGVVGPVRTGKSTLIKRFMDKLVLPNIENDFIKDRARDELPQSAAGRTIMTTEPKFVPNEAVKINIDDKVEFKVRLVDCVGYLVNGALGDTENDMPRMVSTPWFKEPIPFTKAAAIGTKKVINEHSTIGLLVTTDGSITDIQREDYCEAEEMVVRELKEINKPFVVVLNSSNPMSQAAKNLRDELFERYKVPVILTNCKELEIDDINKILENILYEFPVSEIGINIPRWIKTLEDDYWLKNSILESVRDTFYTAEKLRDIENCVDNFSKYDFIKKVYIDKINLGVGEVRIDIALKDNLLFKVLGETSGIQIEEEGELVELMREFARIKREYEKIEFALHEVSQKGYGVVMPTKEEITLCKPELLKQGSRFGVKLCASAPSIHMIRADIETQIAPIVGTQKQSEELVEYLIKEFDEEPQKLWETNIFGKSLNELVTEGLQNKLYRMSDDSQYKLQETLQKIINEGNGGLICIIL
ncbi:MAG: stage IV sporulation protein A [Clostridiales bacterium]|nr:stage IV sporulation protein A [Clostridiales bacterium]